MTGVSAFLIVAAIGSLAQIVDGSLGMGFGVISSASMLAAGFVPAVAVATVNASKMLTGLASGVSHWRVGNVRRDWLLPLTLSGIAGGFLGSLLLTSLAPDTAKPLTGILLLAMGVLTLWRALRWQVPCATKLPDNRCDRCPRGKWERLVVSSTNGSAGKLGAIGFLAAFVNGVSGAYGPIATSGVLLVEKGHARHAIGTVNVAEFFVAITVASTLLVRQGLGQFPIGLVLALALGGILAAPAAALICRRVPSRPLAFVMGLALIALSFRGVALLLQ